MQQIDANRARDAPRSAAVIAGLHTLSASAAKESNDNSAMQVELDFDSLITRADRNKNFEVKRFPLMDLNKSFYIVILSYLNLLQYRLNLKEVYHPCVFPPMSMEGSR